MKVVYWKYGTPMYTQSIQKPIKERVKFMYQVYPNFFRNLCFKNIDRQCRPSGMEKKYIRKK